MEQKTLQQELMDYLKGFHPSEFKYALSRNPAFKKISEGRDVKEINKVATDICSTLMKSFDDAGIGRKDIRNVTLQDRKRIKNGDETYETNAETLLNCIELLEDYSKFELRYNMFNWQLEYREIKLNNKDEWLPAGDDVFLVEVKTHLSKIVPSLKFNETIIKDAILSVCSRNKVDPMVEYLDSLKWDGVERLPTWLSIAIGIEPNPYTDKVGEQWLFAMLKRQQEPGYIYDNCLVLSGGQGLGKTSLFRIIGGKYYEQVVGKIEGNDIFTKVVGKLILDMDEGKSFTQADVDQMKGFLSAVDDKTRKLYTNGVQLVAPRRVVISMTTNKVEFLRDETGNRRFLVVKLNNTVNFDWLKSNREQLFAEAWFKVKRGDSLPEIPKDKLLEAQSDAMERNELEFIITNYFRSKHEDRKAFVSGDRDGFVTTVAEVYIDAINNGVDRGYDKLDYKTQRLISKCLVNIGLESQDKPERVRRFGNGIYRTYRMSHALARTNRARLQADFCGDVTKAMGEPSIYSTVDRNMDSISKPITNTEQDNIPF